MQTISEDVMSTSCQFVVGVLRAFTAAGTLWGLECQAAGQPCSAAVAPAYAACRQYKRHSDCPAATRDLPGHPAPRGSAARLSQGDSVPSHLHIPCRHSSHSGEAGWKPGLSWCGVVSTDRSVRLIRLLFCCLLPQQLPEEDSLSATCELLPALERRDGLSGSNNLYHRNLTDSWSLTPLCSNSSTELPTLSSAADRTVRTRTHTSKRTIGPSSAPSGLLAKKARRRTAERPPLVQRNAEKKQKESNNVSPILQQHNSTTVCVC